MESYYPRVLWTDGKLLRIVERTDEHVVLERSHGEDSFGVVAWSYAEAADFPYELFRGFVACLKEKTKS